MISFGKGTALIDDPSIRPPGGVAERHNYRFVTIEFIAYTAMIVSV